jgi:multiple sugar transport system substrate-binding protein
MGGLNGMSQESRWTERQMTRRGILRYSLLSVAALSVAAACSQASTPAPTSAPAAPTAAPKPTTAPAAAPTTAPTAAPTTAAAAKPTAAATTAAAAQPTAAAKPSTAFSGPPASASLNLPKVNINGQLVVVQARDFHPDHNAFIEAQIKQFAQQMGYNLDHSYIEAYAGSGDVVQKLTAAVQAGDAPDLLIHTLGPSQMHFLDIVEDVTDYETEIQKQQGKQAPAYEKITRLDGKYWAIPHFSRSGTFWARPSYFKAKGIDPLKDLPDYQALADACMKVTDPNTPIYGWGMTANRSGDGDTTIRLPWFMWGGQINDDTGQVVVINKDPYKEYHLAALNWLKDIYTSDKYAAMLPPGVGGWTDPSNNEAWLANKIAFTSNAGTVYAQSVKDQNPVADDTLLLPQFKGLGPGARVLQGPGGPMYFYIMKGAKNKDAAFQIVQYLNTAEAFKQMFTISTGYVYPAREWGWDTPELTEAKYAKNITPVYHKIFEDPSAFQGTSHPASPTPQSNALDNTNFWTDMFGEILGGKAVDQTLSDWHNRVVQTFKEFGAKGE